MKKRRGTGRRADTRLSGMDEAYLPHHPPADLTPYALHVAAQRRTVGSALGRHVPFAGKGFGTEAGKVGRGANLAVQLVEPRDHARCRTDVASVEAAHPRGRSLPEQRGETPESRAKLGAFRDRMAKGREDARSRREKGEREKFVVAPPPGQQDVLDACRLVAAVRRAREQAATDEARSIHSYIEQSRLY